MMNTGNLKVTTPSDTEILMTRVFDAPRALVWEAMSSPDLIKRWLLGPPGWTMVLCEGDTLVGGKFHWSWRGPDGAELSMKGEYKEVNPPERCVRTEAFSFGPDSPIGEQLVTMVLKEENGKTNLILTLLYDSKEARDGAILSGMEHGVASSYDRLAELLSSGGARGDSQAGAR